MDRTHVPFASLSNELELRTVTLYSASKAYNLGGMGCALAHFGTPVIERRLSELPSHLTGRVSVAAVATTLASWSASGDAWLERCLSRLRANREMLGQWLDGAGGEAGVKGFLPEATYLSWLDFRPAGLGDDPAGWLLRSAGVRLSEGLAFGPGGAGFARVNFATTPAILGEILGRIVDALEMRAARPEAPGDRSHEQGSRTYRARSQGLDQDAPGHQLLTQASRLAKKHRLHPERPRGFDVLLVVVGEKGLSWLEAETLERQLEVARVRLHDSLEGRNEVTVEPLEELVTLEAAFPALPFHVRRARTARRRPVRARPGFARSRR